jgi:hypothetical protein
MPSRIRTLEVLTLKKIYFVSGRITACTILMGKSDGKRSLGRPRRTLVDNIKINLREIGWDGMDWIHLAKDGDQWKAIVNTIMNIRFP